MVQRPFRRLGFISALVVGLPVCASAQISLLHVQGTHFGEQLGTAVASIGDVDQDGVADVAVGAPGEVGPFGYGQGMVALCSGATGEVIQRWKGAGLNARLGAAVAAAGDVDNDGVVDLVAGAPGYQNYQGMVRVYSGATFQALHTWTGTFQTGFGGVVAGIDDRDGDGFDDVAASSLGSLPLSEIVVWSGASGLALSTIPGGAYALASVGDVDQDGAPDLAIGDPWASNYAGSVRILSGANDAPILTLAGTSAGEFLGAALARVADLNGDGRDELAVGAPATPPATSGGFGKVRVHALPGGAVLSTLDGISIGDAFGCALAAPGDLDGDGRPEILVGARGGSISNGYATVLPADGGDAWLTVQQGVSLPAFGASVAAAGDADSDGIPDLIVGAPAEDIDPAQQDGAGGVWVFSGFSCHRNYGHGCAGSGAFVPTLTTESCPLPGGDVTLTLDNALSHTTALLVLGTHEAAAPMGFGCTLAVAPLLPLTIAFPVPSGSGFATPHAGDGYAQLTGTIPPTAGAFTLTLQAFVADPGVPAGFAATGGLAIANP